MDIKVKGYLDRAENKLILANANFSISTEEHIKIKLGISSDKTKPRGQQRPKSR